MSQHYKARIAGSTNDIGIMFILRSITRKCERASVGQPELLLSLACNQLYLEGVARVKTERLNGRADDSEKMVKTEKMHNLVKNKTKHYC